jgi:hypothetical protein
MRMCEQYNHCEDVQSSADSSALSALMLPPGHKFKRLL